MEAYTQTILEGDVPKNSRKKKTNQLKIDEQTKNRSRSAGIKQTSLNKLNEQNKLKLKQ